MKAKIKNLLMFCCMVIVLGTQALLEGSWKVEPSKGKSVKA
jgi:hypothetical protein